MAQAVATTAQDQDTKSEQDARAAALAAAKRSYKRCATATDVAAWVNKHKMLGYRKLIPIIANGGTKAPAQTLTVKRAVACQKEYRACETRADVEAWVAANVNTITPRRAGCVIAYAGYDITKHLD